MIIDIHLGTNGEYTISYEFYDNPVAKLIYERMKSQENDLVQRDNFCNFGETEEEIRAELEEITEKLRGLLDFNDGTVLDLNRLHENFPTYNRLYQKDKTIGPLLSRFNGRLHHLEHLENHNRQASFFVMAANDDGVPIEDDTWYDLFTPFRKLGEMYHHYPHVGKHFLEMLIDEDYDIPKDQIQLTSKIANTFCFWFSDTHPTGGVEYRKLWYWGEEFHKKMAHKLPYEWGDKRLAIGHIPIGMVIGDPKQIRNEIPKYRHVHSWTLR